MSAVRVITISEEDLRRLIREELRASREMQPAGKTEPASGYMTVPAAADYASVVPETIRDWIAAGRLPYRRAGRHYRVARADLDRLLAAPPTKTPVDTRARAMEIVRSLRG